MLLSQPTSLLSWNEIKSTPLSKDGLIVLEARPSQNRITKTSELGKILSKRAPNEIILFKRSDLAPSLLEEINLESRIPTQCHENEWNIRWHQTGGLSSANAMPHLHDHRNCHAAVKPSQTPTAFFTRETVIQAVEFASLNRSYGIELRSELRKALEAESREGNQSAIFHALHHIEPPKGRSEIELLLCIKQIQQYIQDSRGLFTVSLKEQDYGIVSIPAFCVHGRFVLNDLGREVPTAWRYFGLPEQDWTQNFLS